MNGRDYFPRYNERTWWDRNGKGVVAALIICALGFFGIVACNDYAKTTPVHIIVNDKESVSTDSGHEYRVYTDQGTFKVGDSIVHPRFNSADVYGSLRRGHTYDCKAFGWRIPLFSTFKNLTDCKEVG
jgi:hypothetical protein